MKKFIGGFLIAIIFIWLVLILSNRTISHQESGITLKPGESMTLGPIVTMSYNFKYERYESSPDSIGKWEEFIPQDDWVQEMYQNFIESGDLPVGAALKTLSVYLVDEKKTML